MRRHAAVGALLCFAVAGAFLAAAASNPYSNLALRYQQVLGGLGVVAGVVLLVATAVLPRARDSLDARGRRRSAAPLVVAGPLMALAALAAVAVVGVLSVLAVMAALSVANRSEAPTQTVAPPPVPGDIPAPRAPPSGARPIPVGTPPPDHLVPEAVEPLAPTTAGRP